MNRHGGVPPRAKDALHWCLSGLALAGNAFRRYGVKRCALVVLTVAVLGAAATALGMWYSTPPPPLPSLLAGTDSGQPTQGLLQSLDRWRKHTYIRPGRLNPEVTLPISAE